MKSLTLIPSKMYLAGLIFLIKESYCLNRIQFFCTDNLAWFAAPALSIGTPSLNPSNIHPPEPTQYIYSNLTDIPQVDIKIIVQYSNTATTEMLFLNIFW